MGLNLEDAIEQEGSWDSFLMHHSGWFVEDEPSELADWGAFAEQEEDDHESSWSRPHVEMADSGRLNPEGIGESAAFHTSDDEDGPFYPDEFIPSLDDL